MIFKLSVLLCLLAAQLIWGLSVFVCLVVKCFMSPNILTLSLAINNLSVQWFVWFM